MVPGTGIEPVRPKAADFKSATSTNFVTRASSDRALILHEWGLNVLSVDVKFAIPIYENNKLVRYNIFGARLLVNHSYNGKKYLYDIVAIKKETSKPHH